MSFGLSVFNERNREILNSNDFPFRFVTAAEPFDADSAGWMTRHWYRKDITGRFSATSMIYVEAPDPVQPLWGGNALTRNVHFNISVSEGRTWLYLTSGGVGTFFGVPDKMPVFYIVDKIPPPQAAVGIGINVWDGSGRPVFNSSTPLAQVEDVVQVTPSRIGFEAVADIGSAEGRICIVENVAGGVSTIRYKYSGGGGVIVNQWYSIDVAQVGANFQATTVFWDEETGQSPTRAPWVIPLRCILLKKPSKSYGW